MAGVAVCTKKELDHGIVATAGEVEVAARLAVQLAARVAARVAAASEQF